MVDKAVENVSYCGAVLGINLSKQIKVINKGKVRYIWPCFAYGDRGLVQNVYFMVYPSGKELHTHNKNVAGDRVTLPYSSYGAKSLNFASINQDGNGSCREAGHDDPGYLWRNIEEMHCLPNERLFYPIKSLLQINFKNRITLFTFHFKEMSDILLQYDGIVRSPSVG